MIKIDGSYLEGGGQILRTSLALSAITQKSFEICDIRKGRKDPGLKNQHLYGVRALKELCNAVVEGDEIGSTFLRFYPRKFTSKNIEVDIETAGSITLVMQSLMLPCLFAGKPITISLTGGTDVSWSPSFDYLSNVLVPQLQRFAKVKTRLIKRGYYPRGQGKAEIKINPKIKLNDFPSFEDFRKKTSESVIKFDLVEQGHLIHIKGISHASKTLQSAKVAERQAEAAQNELKETFNVPIRIDMQYQETSSIGSGITLWAIFSRKKEDIDENNPIRIGSDTLGEQGKKAEIVGKECSLNLIKEIGSKAPADRLLADQLLVFACLISGSRMRTSELTNHLKTNIYTIKQFLGETFEIDENERLINIF